MTWVGVAITAGGAIYSGVKSNQDRQNQKGLEGKQLALAEQNYADRGPYRDAAKTALLNPQTYDYSGDYLNPMNPVATGGQFAPITAGKYTGNVDKAVADLAGGPDRVAMAKQALADFDTAGAPALAARFKAVGQNAAKLGRIGSGGVTSELGTLQSDYERNRMLTANDLIRQLTEADAADRFKKLSAFSDVNAEDLAGQRGERAFGLGLGEQAITDRERARDAAAKAAGFDLSRGLGLAGLGAGADTALYDAYGRAADRAGERAGAASAGAGDLFALAGDLYSRGRYRNVGAPTGTTVSNPTVYG